MVTMEDISIELGCSINTVSKALNNKPDVSAKTRQLVLETARRMGYVPNSLAKSLVTRISGTLGVIAPSVTVAIFAELVETIMITAAEYNYSVFLALSSGDPDAELAAVEKLYQKRADGLIIVPVTPTPSYHESLLTYKEPVVYTLNDVEYDTADFVGVDLGECAYRTTQHLIDQGCRRLALLCATRMGMTPGVEAGYLRCIEDNGLLDTSNHIFKPKALLNPQDAGYEIALMLDDKIEAFDGIILEYEELYFGLNRLLDAHGLSCPKDLLVAASIGMDVKKSPYLSLTSVEADPEKIGKRALARLIKQIRGETDIVPGKERTKCSLICRKSSRRQ